MPEFDEALVERAEVAKPVNAVIPLTRGLLALIDPDILPLVQDYSWSAARHKHTHYAATRERGTGRHIYMHRLITGAVENQVVDHINHDGLDNRRCNLRVGDQTMNLHNSNLPPSTSAFRGVSWYARERCWHAQIQVKRKNIHLGYFASEIEAAKAYDEARERFLGTGFQRNIAKEPPHG